MTNQEKCALIAEELEGWQWAQYRHPAMRSTHAPIDPLNSGPDYCRDLNACARAERVIGERGLTAEYWGLGDAYTRALRCVLHRRGITLADMFHFVTASAQDRVDAMVMLISDIQAKRNAQQPVGHTVSAE